MELGHGISSLFGVAANRLVWRVDPGLRLQKAGRIEEERFIASAVAKRAREFRSGRNLARAALARLGAPVAALLRGPRGLPDWPDGVAGSISHSDRLAIAVVGWRRDFAGLGIDVEDAAPLDLRLLKLVMTAADQRFIATRDGALRCHWAKTVFSAKEAFYKAVFPRTEQPLDFSDVAIQPLSSIVAETGAFAVVATTKRTAESGLCPLVCGRWLRQGTHVFSFAYLPAEVAAPHPSMNREMTLA